MEHIRTFYSATTTHTSSRLSIRYLRHMPQAQNSSGGDSPAAFLSAFVLQTGGGPFYNKRAIDSVVGLLWSMENTPASHSYSIRSPLTARALRCCQNRGRARLVAM